MNLLFNRIKESSGVEVLDTIPINAAKNDFMWKLIYPDGKKLAIIAQGDYGNEIEEYRKDFEDCDILVCACNKKFMRSRKVKPFDMVTDYDPLTTIVLKKKYEPAEEETCKKANEACVEHLLDLIEIIRKQIK